MFFLRKSNLERLPVAMSGVRMGERALQIGIDDPSLAGAIAAKVGLSGHAAMAVRDERSAVKARAAAARAGVLVDVQVTPFHALPFADDSFEVIVVHGRSRWLSSLDESARTAVLHESARVLRAGGRLVVIEAGAHGGLGALLRPHRGDKGDDTKGGAVASLILAGLKGARVLADREGYRFTEALKA